MRLTEAMPLALILAAGWITIMSPAEIAGELGRSLDFLQATHRDVPPRQRSMRAVFDSTWQRMSAREQALFAALSVFRGGFTLEAARAVTGAAPQELLRLVDRSLLARAESGRFAVHELLRQFAAERLEEGGEGEAIRDAHSAYYLQLLAERLPDLKGRDQLGALRAIERDFENVRAAWGRAIGQEQWQSLPKAGESLCLFALFRSRHRDSIELFEAVRRALPSPASEDERLAYAYATAGRSVQLSWLGVPSVALAAIPELEAVIEGLTDPAALAYCRLMRAGTQYDVNFGDETAAMGAAEAARAYYRQTQEPFYWAFALYVAGFAHWVALRREKGRRLLHHGLALAREAGDRFIAGNLLGTLGGLTWSMDGPTEEAESHFQQAAQLFLELGTPALYARNLIARARVLMWREGDLAESRPLLEEALAVATEQNVSYIHASALAALCTHHWLAGEHEAVLLRTEEMLAMELKKRWVWSWCWATLLRGVVFLAAGDIDGAIPLIRQALSRLVEAASLRWIVSTLPYGGALLARLGKHERGVELLALGLTSFHRGLLELDPLLTRTRSELEEILGEGRFAAAWERGRHLEVRAAATEALAELESLT